MNKTFLQLAKDGIKAEFNNGLKTIAATALAIVKADDDKATYKALYEFIKTTSGKIGEDWDRVKSQRTKTIQAGRAIAYARTEALMKCETIEDATALLRAEGLTNWSLILKQYKADGTRKDPKQEAEPSGPESTAKTVNKELTTEQLINDLLTIYDKMDREAFWSTIRSISESEKARVAA